MVGKLKAVPPMLTPLAPKIGWIKDGTQAAPNWRPWRAWYSKPEWRRLRWRVLVRDLFTCRMCGRLEPESRNLVADHVRPHRGDAGLFWDEGNVQTLCKTCHDGAKQREEQGRR